MIFNWLTHKQKIKTEKTNKSEIFVCKHCKLSCKDCESIFCFNCFMREENPCPGCGKRNADYDINVIDNDKTSKNVKKNDKMFGIKDRITMPKLKKGFIKKIFSRKHSKII